MDEDKGESNIDPQVSSLINEGKLMLLNGTIHEKPLKVSRIFIPRVFEEEEE